MVGWITAPKRAVCLLSVRDSSEHDNRHPALWYRRALAQRRFPFWWICFQSRFWSLLRVSVLTSSEWRIATGRSMKILIDAVFNFSRKSKFKMVKNSKFHKTASFVTIPQKSCQLSQLYNKSLTSVFLGIEIKVYLSIYFAPPDLVPGVGPSCFQVTLWLMEGLSLFPSPEVADVSNYHPSTRWMAT